MFCPRRQSVCHQHKRWWNMNTVRRDENTAHENLYLNSLRADSPGMFNALVLCSSVKFKILSSNW